MLMHMTYYVGGWVLIWQGHRQRLWALKRDVANLLRQEHDCSVYQASLETSKLVHFQDVEGIMYEKDFIC